MPRKAKTQEMVPEETIVKNVPNDLSSPAEDLEDDALTPDVRAESDAPVRLEVSAEADVPAEPDASAESEVFAEADVPAESIIPAISDISEAPDTPARSNASARSDIPATPNVPAASNAFTEPGVPVELDASADPDDPTELDVPVKSDVPAEPNASVAPKDEPDGEAPLGQSNPLKPDFLPMIEPADESGSKQKNQAPAPKPKKTPTRQAKAPAPTSILTLNADDEVETPQSREDAVWHELQNAYRTHKILTGILGGIERSENGSTIVVVYYKDMRVIIPLSEMMINLPQDDAHDYGELNLRQNKILGNMLGCEIDFLIKGLENASRSIVASRKDAMLKKRQIFYLPDANGNSRVCEDRIVQARVIAVGEKVVRVEIFGVECSILARDLSWDWLGDATESFHVGEQILVRILSVKCNSVDDITVKADVKSVNGNSKTNLSKCKVQGKYAGTITDIYKGTVFVRLHIGVNAIAHSCYDSRMPGKKDEVSFVVTKLDEERNVAVGLISRIIRQNI